ncbi:MAG: hypothetical protein ACHQNV_00865 [Vicinamibacteria bacterium]
MNIRNLASSMVLLGSTVVASAALAQAPLGDAKIKALEASIDRALSAYNKQDSRAFYAEYTSAMAASPEAADRMFHAAYDEEIKQLGKYVSRKLIADESGLEGDAPLFVYEAKFTGAPRVKVSVHFTKDGSTSKIMNIELDKM